MSLLIKTDDKKPKLDIDQITPFNKYVLVEFVSAERTKGGLYIPVESQASKGQIFVRAVGKNCDSGIQVGDEVRVIKKVQPVAVDANNEDLAFLREDHIAGCVNRSPAAQ